MRLWSHPALEVEDRLFRALAILRVVVLVNAIALNVYRADNFARPAAGVAAVLVMVGWTGFVTWAYAAPVRRTTGLVAADLAVALGLLLASPLIKGDGLRATVPGFWVMAALLAWAIHWHWRGGLVAGVLLAAGDLVRARRRQPEQLRERVPARRRRPDRGVHVRVAGADGARAGRRPAGGGGGRGTSPAGARRARRRAPGAGPRPAARGGARAARPGVRRARAAGR